MNNPVFAFVLCLVAMLLPLVSPSATGKEYDHGVQGRVVSNMTGTGMDSISVILLTADSTALDTVQAAPASAGEDAGLYHFSIRKVGRYIVKAECPGYIEACQPFELRSNREWTVFVKPIRMIKIQQLREVSVSVTKIKMVMRGDTIVYNADAFQLAEGSMLDALIARLPGAKLTKEGKIYVHGRYISCLLINGQDFFSGNPRLALENLPAYTVKQIKVFDKSGFASRAVRRDMGDKQYTMDVRLKKEYAVGYMGNHEMGAGTDRRYMSKAFLSRYAEKEFLFAFANINNLNDNQTASISGDWSPQDLPDGLLTNRTVNLSYARTFHSPLDYFSTANTFSHTDADNQTIQSSQTFLPHGDLFRESNGAMVTKVTTVSSKSELAFQPQGRWLRTAVFLDYSRRRGLGHERQTMTDAASLINSLVTRDARDVKTFSFNLENSMGRNIIADLIRWEGSAKYDQTSADDFSLYDLSFASSATPRDFRNNYRSERHRHWQLKGVLQYDINWPGVTLMPEYAYRFVYNKTDNLLYRLDKLSDSDSTRFDLLPSTRKALLDVLDAGNSYRFHEYQNHHQVALHFRADQLLAHLERLTSWYCDLNLPLRYVNKNLYYHRRGRHDVSRHALFLEPQFTLGRRSRQLTWELKGSFRSDIPDMTYLVDYTDDADPLNIMNGNGDLRNIHRFDASLSIRGEGTMQRLWSVSVDYCLRDNGIAFGMQVDKVTGRTWLKPVSVDGNWQGNAAFNYAQALDEAHKWSIDHQLSVGYRHSIDMATTAGSGESMRSIVSSWHIADLLKLGFRPAGNHEFSLRCGGNYHIITGQHDGFGHIKAGDYQAGLNVLLRLSWSLSLSTDMTMYARRGYQSSAMNTTDWVWNAQLARAFCHERLLVRLQGLDLLRQLSTTQYAVNAQGRTETWHNSLPRYAMLSLTWKLNVNSRKR